jgi:hypothetical protein
MQSGDDLQNVWMMFDHVKHVQGWATMACHIYDLVYYKVMMIAVSDMQFEDMEVQCILWRKLNVVIERKRLGMPFSRGSWRMVHKQTRILFALFMGLEILRSRWLTKGRPAFSIGLNLSTNIPGR